MPARPNRPKSMEFLLAAGLYKSREEAFASLKRLEVIEPEAADREALEASYERWKQALERRLS